MEPQECVGKDDKQLSYGYTTGSCAAAAAGAAAKMLFSGKRVEQMRLMTPKGMELILEMEDIHMNLPYYVNCAVRKDAGDDPDVTDGVLVYAKVELGKERTGRITIEGGTGVGRVSKPGLDQPVGEAAINSGPRKQIVHIVSELCKLYHRTEDIHITISIPEGVALAEKTFNPRLGIQGGISVLGTTGIVEPMSDQALLDTILLELKMHAALGEKLIAMSPGNYGLGFMLENFGYPLDQAVKCSNFVKASMEMAATSGIERIVFTGHIGKLIKVAAGAENTHSAYGDGRMEMLAKLACQFGGSSRLRQQLLDCVVTEEAIKLLQREGIQEPVMENVVRLVQTHMEAFSENRVEVEVILFSKELGLLAKTQKAVSWIKELGRFTR